MFQSTICDRWELNQIDYDEFNLLWYYFNLYMSRFKYKNCPESISKVQLGLQNLDRFLWFCPAVAFFDHPIEKLQFLPVTKDANINIAYYPDTWHCIGGDGFRSEELNFDNSVLVFNDSSRVPPLVFVYKYVKKIVELEKTCDQNVKHQRQPFIFEIDEEQKKSAKAMFLSLESFNDCILTRKNKGKGTILEGIKAVPTKTEFEAEKYLAARDKYENIILSYLGINNVQIQKAERLITSEADSNNQKIYTQFSAALESRKEALKRVNELFGTNIEVVPNDLIAPSLQAEKKEEGGNDNDNFNVNRSASSAV